MYRDMLKDDFFERITQSPNISIELFRLANEAFRTERLLLDEEDVFSSSLHTTVSRIKKLNTPYTDMKHTIFACCHT